MGSTFTITDAMRRKSASGSSRTNGATCGIMRPTRTTRCPLARNTASPSRTQSAITRR